MNNKHFTCYGFDCNILGPLDGMYMYSINTSYGNYIRGFIQTNEENEPVRYVKDLCRDIFLCSEGGVD